MKRLSWALGIVIAGGVATAVAQPPAGRGGPGGGGPGGGGPGGGRPSMPLIEALDSDHDHVISADELKHATASLLTLDKNSDGKLTESEYGPQMNGPGMGGGPGRGPGGPQGGGRGGNNSRRPQQGRGDQGGPEGDGPGGGRDGRPGPNPDRLVEHAMEFDSDNDGKLSKAELLKFAEDFAKHHPGPGGGGPGGPGGPGGQGPKEGGGGQRPQRPD